MKDIRYIYTFNEGSQREFTGTYKELVKELEKTREYLKKVRGKRYIIGYELSCYISEIDPDNFGTPCRKVDVIAYLHNVIGMKRVTEHSCKGLVNRLNTGKLRFEELYNMYGYV